MASLLTVIVVATVAATVPDPTVAGGLGPPSLTGTSAQSSEPKTATTTANSSSQAATSTESSNSHAASPAPSGGDNSGLLGALIGAAATLGAGVIGGVVTINLQGRKDMKGARRALLVEIDHNAEFARTALKSDRLPSTNELFESTYRATALTIARGVDKDLWSDIAGLYQDVYGAKASIGRDGPGGLSAETRVYLGSVDSAGTDVGTKLRRL